MLLAVIRMSSLTRSPSPAVGADEHRVVDRHPEAVADDGGVPGAEQLDAAALEDAVADELEGALLPEVLGGGLGQPGGEAVADDPLEVAVGHRDVGAVGGVEAVRGDAVEVDPAGAHLVAVGQVKGGLRAPAALDVDQLDAVVVGERDQPAGVAEPLLRRRQVALEDDVADDQPLAGPVVGGRASSG